MSIFVISLATDIVAIYCMYITPSEKWFPVIGPQFHGQFLLQDLRKASPPSTHTRLCPCCWSCLGCVQVIE